jgi:hypothetical protein
MREEQYFTAWYEAHGALRTYLEPWTDVDMARQLASTAVAVWMQSAADGEQPPSGPYAALYAAAYILLGSLSIRYEVPDDVTAMQAVPLNTTLLPYQLSKLYVDIWKAAQFLAWDRKTIHRVSRGLALIWPVSDSGWAPLGPVELGRLVPPLARRAVETLEHHRCLDCAICTEASLRWENADRATEEWFTERRLARME